MEKKVEFIFQWKFSELEFELLIEILLLNLYNVSKSQTPHKQMFDVNGVCNNLSPEVSLLML